MATYNEEFLDALLRHQIFLLRYSGSVRNQVFLLLRATEQDVVDKIRSRMLTGELSPGVLKRLEVLQRSIGSIRLRAWKNVRDVWLKELVDLASQEAEFVSAMIKTISPVQVDLLLPSPERLRFIATGRPFEGKILKDWANDLSASDLKRIEGQIKIGLVQGESGPVVARRVTRVFDISRRHAETITRTAVTAISAGARAETFKENKDLFDEELFVATLDSRTTPICRSLDGDRYPVGSGPIPPLHMNCRSVRVAILLGEILGVRPAKPTTTRLLLKEFADAEGIDIVKTRSGLPRGFRRRFDSFARQRIKELVGPIPAKVNYQDWLSRQSAAFQDEVLGPTRGKLFRSGGLTVDQFVDSAGHQITLKELAHKEAEAFRRAGFDPEDFY